MAGKCWFKQGALNSLGGVMWRFVVFREFFEVFGYVELIDRVVDSPLVESSLWLLL